MVIYLGWEVNLASNRLLKSVDIYEASCRECQVVLFRRRYFGFGRRMSALQDLVVATVLELHSISCVHQALGWRLRYSIMSVVFALQIVWS